MKIILVGGGVVGSAIVSALCPEGHDICVIDTNPASLAELEADFDISVIEGSGINVKTLEEAGIKNCDLFIATTDIDELNLLSCVMAKQLGVNACVARVRNPAINNQMRFMRNQLGINRIVNPEFNTANHLSRMLRIPSATHVETFANGRIDMVEMDVPEGSIIDGVALKDLNSKIAGAKILVCAVQRDGEDTAIIPDGNYVMRAGDKIHFTADHEQISSFFRQVGLLKTKIKNVMLIGGGRIAFYLSRMLTDSGMNVKIIEKSTERCKELSKSLSKAKIINGDAANQDLLIDEGIADFDACITLTEEDASNIVISLFARTKNVPKIITKVNSSDLRKMALEAGLMSHVTPKELTAASILSYVRSLKETRGGAITNMYKLVDGSVEAMEFVAAEGGKAVGKSLAKLGLKRQLLIAGIFRDGKLFFPSGSDRIEKDDTVIVVTTNKHITSLDQIVE